MTRGREGSKKGDVICGRPLNVIAYGSKWSRTVWWLAISHYHQHDCIWSVKRGTYYKYTIDRKWSSISILYYNTFFSALNQCVLKSANSEMLYKILSINPSFLIHFCTIFGIFGAMWAQRDIYHSGVYGTFLCVQKGSYVDEDREMLRGHLTLRNSYLLKPAILYCTFYGVFNSEQSYFYMLVFVSTNVLQRSRKVNLVLALWRSGS